MSAALLMLARPDATPPPCAGVDGWTSEDHDERALAARCCAGCALFDPCRVLADELKASFGVWAGRDRGLERASNAVRGVGHVVLAVSTVRNTPSTTTRKKD